MLNIALATLRTRWVSFAGAFIALALGTGMIAMMALTLAATIGTPHDGPQRFATAQTVVVPADPRGDPAKLPAQLSADLVTRAAAAGQVTEDRSFDVLLQDTGLAVPPTVGHGWSAAAFTPYHLTAGRAPAAADEIVVGGAPADLVGRHLKVATDRSRGEYTVVGVTDQVWFEDALFFTDRQAAKLSPPVNALVSTASEDSVRKAVGDGPLVLSGDDRRNADPDPSGGADALTNAQAMAGTTTVIAASVAVFIVIATFAFVVDQRRRELALFRLVGATPKQVRQMVVAESALIGLGAALVGCVLGSIASGRLNTWMIDNGVAPRWFEIGLNPIALLIAFLIGTGAALAGAGSVALRASRVRPVEALRDAAASTKSMTPMRWVLGLGLLVAAVITGWSISSTSAVSAVNPRKYGMVPLLYTGAFALLAPVILRPIARLATWPLSKIGAGPLIVRQNTLNSRRRTAATVAPVVVAVGLVATMLCVQTAGDRTKVDQARQQTHADYVVTPKGGKQLAPETVAALAAVPGAEVTTVAPMRIYIANTDGQVLDSLTGQAVAPAALGSALTPKVIEGSLEHLDDGFIVVDQKTAKGDDLTLGQRLVTWLPDGSRTELKIAAIVQTGLGTDATFLSSAHTSTGSGPDRAWVRFASGTDSAAAAGQLAAALKGQPVKAAPVAVYFEAMKAKQKAQTQTAATVILGISVGYSLISVANTLIMAAAGRRRELAALNLAGATKSQVLRVVGAESLLAVVIGSILAAVAGAAVVATQRLSLVQLVHGVPLTVPWTPIWQVGALCTAVAVAAAVVSAWRVTQRRPIEVLGMRE
ncbi:hypothetical protein CFP65_3397 [Kitasatospora sp. MMS16-BH015]|uniref:ABC transporter permease n=1 Tax=Kitasatospora sp. MMS16-BH015 TaxID=2018025 RepID=UPI000CA0DC67|nr:ABC transporter permease [Kitasatospora sp. MMS16-BH015]AUG78193.1 hypothetical protein CFP65_3397 [Kitasatospora sp. MMS16-BH015]